MPRQPNVSAENNFTGGLKTEFTGLNFPENACTDTDNCIFNRIGNVTRRLGIDYETNYTATSMAFSNLAISYFKWENAGGDGSTKVLVVQVGSTLHFYNYSSATVADPLSDQKLVSTVTLSTFLAPGGTFDPTLECNYASGNGYLFVFHPNCESFYCTYSSGTVVASVIDISIRDFVGLPVPIADDFRPPIGAGAYTNEHIYNIQNQGWVNNPPWTGTSTTLNTTSLGSHTWTIQTGLVIIAGQTVSVQGLYGFEPDAGTTRYIVYETGTVTGYNNISGALTLNITNTSLAGVLIQNWTFASVDASYIGTFLGATGTYPSNSDVWWRFKNAANVFDPITTLDQVSISTGPAPKGHKIFSAFNLNFQPSSVVVLTTPKRPRTGTWFQGRVWYTGVDAVTSLTLSPGLVATAIFSETIYFSQIVESTDHFGKCYQKNDPTDENLFDLLPSDGGTIKIQGCGSIYKLFPIQNGMLVFAANGIWFITGNQGIGFTANDYTITKISAIQSISSTSFVDVQGLPVWWNEEGIYTVSPAQQGGGPSERIAGLSVTSLTFPTISSFYEAIPLISKRYVKGDYNPLTYTIQWVYRDSKESDATTRYQFDRILNFNTGTQSFFPWTVSTGTGATPHINGVVYIPEPSGGTDLESVFKYPTTFTNSGEFLTFSEEKDTTYKDWETQIEGIDYSSFFVTGYKLHGQAQRKFQPTYVYMYSTNEVSTSYKIQGIWNFANSGNSGKFSSTQLVDINLNNFDKTFRRHKIRGSGIALQFKVLSSTGKPFDIMGWSIFETINASI